MQPTLHIVGGDGKSLELRIKYAYVYNIHMQLSNIGGKPVEYQLLDLPSIEGIDDKKPAELLSKTLVHFITN